MSSIVIGAKPRIFFADWSTALVEGEAEEEVSELGGAVRAGSEVVVAEPSRGGKKAVD